MSAAPLLLSALLAAPPDGGAAGEPNPADRPNVLLVIVDDLRPELGCYGVPHARTPHLDAFADTAVRFSRAYCQVPTCGASRASLFTGLRPGRRRFTTHLTRVDEDAPGVIPLHAHFRANGYRTASLGKVLHHKNDSAAGWTDPPWRPERSGYCNPESLALEQSAAGDGTRATRGPPFEAGRCGDDFYPDGKIAAEAVRRLGSLQRERTAGGEPWLLAVGFLKPHLPFACPAEYWDLHPPESVGPPVDYEVPEHAPAAAIHRSGELRHYGGVPAEGPVSDAMAHDLIRGYRACVSFADANVGRVLAALEESGAAGNTVVVVISDHGWNLGEHTLWCKHSCFETSLRVPLLIRAPGVSTADGAAPGLAELLDLYPTLCDLTGLPTPDHLAGESLRAQLADPTAAGKAEAVSRYAAGDTLRTDDLRFTEYTAPLKPGSKARPRAVGRMLYDHRADPGETVNVAGAADYKDEAAALLNRLNAVAGSRAERAGAERP